MKSEWKSLTLLVGVLVLMLILAGVVLSILMGMLDVDHAAVEHEEEINALASRVREIEEHQAEEDVVLGSHSTRIGVLETRIENAMPEPPRVIFYEDGETTMIEKESDAGESNGR